MRVRLRQRLLLAGTLALLANPARAAAQDNDARSQLEELGTTFKAAVVSGTLSHEDATRAWSILARRTKENAFSASADRKTDKKYNDAGRSLLKPAGPGIVNAIFQPEFLHRDIATLRDTLNLDASQLTIVELILDDYYDTLDLAATPLRESLIEYRRTREDRWLTATLERIHIDDPEAAIARVREATAETQPKNKTPQLSRSSKSPADDPWTARMIDATRHLEERFDAIRSRVEAERAGRDSNDAELTKGELLHIADQLRHERNTLRNDVITALEVITNTEQRGPDNTQFDFAIQQLLIARHLRHTRLAGDAINYRALLIDVQTKAESRNATDHAQSILQTHTPIIAAALHQRASAEIMREIVGIEYFADLIKTHQPDDLDDIRQEYVRTLMQEIDAAISARDAVLQPLDQITAALQHDTNNSNIADDFKHNALASTFPDEMRPRFAETSLTRALTFTDLNDEQRIVIATRAASVEDALTLLRSNAVAARVEDEPETTRQFVKALFEEKGEYVRASQPPWNGYLNEQFQSLDEQIRNQLESILTPSQFAAFETKPALPDGEKTKAPTGPGLMNSSESRSGGKKKSH